MKLKESWYEPSVGWGALIADPSTCKSAAQDLGTEPIDAIEDKMRDEYGVELKHWKIDQQEWAGDRKTNLQDAPQKPPQPRLKVSDITVEKVAHILSENPRGIMLVRDELSGWFASFGRYSKNSGPSADVSQWLEVFRARRLTIDRKTGDLPSIFVRRAAVSILGTIQPGVVRRLMNAAFFEGGMAGRFLFAMPPRAAKKWTEAVIPKLVKQDYHSLFDAIFTHTRQEKYPGDEFGKAIEFNAAGKKAWIDFYNEWGDRQSASHGERTYALAKLEGYAARICLLLAVADFFSDDTRAEEVNGGHVKRAKQIVEWFAYETDRVYSMVATPEERAEEERLLDFVASTGGVMTPRRLLRANPAKYKTSDRARQVLQDLVSKGAGAWAFRPNPDSHSGRPVKVFELVEEV